MLKSNRVPLFPLDGIRQHQSSPFHPEFGLIIQFEKFRMKATLATGAHGHLAMCPVNGECVVENAWIYDDAREH
jgi:hypothetical protein